MSTAVVDSAPLPGRTNGPLSRRTAIPTSKKRKTAAPAKRRSAKPARAAGKPRRGAVARKAKRSAPIVDHPLGMGVADGFAMDRLAAPARMKRAPKKAVREIGWAAFGEVARSLAQRIAARYEPDVVVGVAKGGVFVGGALAAALGVDFYPVRIEKRRRDAAPLPEPVVELPDLSRKKVLVVDDVAASGATLAKARAVTRKAGAREVRTAVLVVRPDGARPDFSFLETDELVLFGWDYQLDGGEAGGVDPGEVGV
ncbi:MULTISPECIES: phosphoribosyltransferase [Anaeromyxobacter]|uniref:phosphoribosyltransferase n=1 Tax=Anaeromyxobacter TaxID=161492 RepID=UPI001F56636F|nr:MULTISPECIES: phosphoribosyltransferase [unclassified Anaeromyxobacter]